MASRWIQVTDADGRACLFKLKDKCLVRAEKSGGSVIHGLPLSPFAIKESPSEVLALLGSGEAVDFKGVRDVLARLRQTYEHYRHKDLVSVPIAMNDLCRLAALADCVLGEGKAEGIEDVVEKLRRVACVYDRYGDEVVCFGSVTAGDLRRLVAYFDGRKTDA